MRFSAAAGIETEAGRGEKLQSSPVRCGRYRDSVPCQLLTSQPPRGEPEQPNNLKQSPCPHLVSPLNGRGEWPICYCVIAAVLNLLPGSTLLVSLVFSTSPTGTRTSRGLGAPRAPTPGRFPASSRPPFLSWFSLFYSCK